MKRFFRILMVAVLIIANGAAAMAQKADNKQRMTREELAQKQAKYIVNQLALDNKTAEKFTATYCDFQSEVWALGPRIKDAKDMTDDEAKAQMKLRFDRSQKILKLREKYYDKYSEFLTPKQIERVYKIEKQMHNRFDKQHKKGMQQRKRQHKPAPMNSPR